VLLLTLRLRRTRPDLFTMAVVVVGGVLLAIRRPEITWLGCAALPEACVAATNPVAVAVGANQR